MTTPASPAKQVHAQANYTVVNVADNSTTVSAGPALLLGYFVGTGLSAHALPFKDNTTTVISAAASATAGTLVTLPFGIRFETKLIVDPDDDATGSVTVFWRPL